MEGTQEVVGTRGAGSVGPWMGAAACPPLQDAAEAGGQPGAVCRMRSGAGSPWAGCYLCQGDTKMGCGAWGGGQGSPKCWAVPQLHRGGHEAQVEGVEQNQGSEGRARPRWREEANASSFSSSSARRTVGFSTSTGSRAPTRGATEGALVRPSTGRRVGLGGPNSRTRCPQPSSASATWSGRVGVQ